GGGAGMRLHICELASEKLGNPLDCQVFRVIDILAAAVVAPPRQPFGILVGEDRALRFQDRLADDVFRRDQLDLVALAAELARDDVGDLGIGLGERCGEQAPGIGVALGTGWRRIGHRFHLGSIWLSGWPSTPGGMPGGVAYTAPTAKLWAERLVGCPHLGVLGGCRWVSAARLQRFRPYIDPRVTQHSLATLGYARIKISGRNCASGHSPRRRA